MIKCILCAYALIRAAFTPIVDVNSLRTCTNAQLADANFNAKVLSIVTPAYLNIPDAVITRTTQGLRITIDNYDILCPLHRKNGLENTLDHIRCVATCTHVMPTRSTMERGQTVNDK